MKHDLGLLFAVALAIVSVVVTTSIHYETLHLLLGLTHRRKTRRTNVIVLLAGLIAIHLAEITLYAFIFMLGAGPLGLGGFSGDNTPGFMTMLHFAAETYSTLGYGDIVPTGDLRLIAGVEALNGLLMIAWSGAVLSDLVQDLTPKSRARRSMEAANRHVPESRVLS